MNRPYVHINVAMTADGKIDTFERKGTVISSPSDKERVDKLRAESHAVLVGGHTLLHEDPKLTVKSEALRAGRVEVGLPPNPAKVGIVSCADFRPNSNFLHSGPARIFIFTTTKTDPAQIEMLHAGHVEVFIHAGERVNLEAMLETLIANDIHRVMVEGGGTLNFELIRRGLVDEITAYVAPVIFGGDKAPTLADGPGLPREATVHLKLTGIESWEDGGVILRYHLK